MKKSLSMALIVMMFLTRCGQQSPTSTPTEPAEKTEDQSWCDTLIMKEYQDKLGRYTFGPKSLIPLSEAKILMRDFLKDQTRETYAKDFHFGGVFDRSVFEMQPQHAGVLLWFCYDENEPADKRFFLAAEKVTGYTPGTTVRPNGNVSLPYYFVKYSSPDITLDAIEHFLKTQPNAGLSNSSTLPASAAAARTTASMQKWRQLLSVAPDKLIRYPYGFFGDMSEDFQITKLLAQKDSAGNPIVKGVAYYFGYEEKDINGNEINNKIRIILIATDANGNHILPSLSPTRGTDLILQKSFPPPPNN